LQTNEYINKRLSEYSVLALIASNQKLHFQESGPEYTHPIEARKAYHMTLVHAWEFREGDDLNETRGTGKSHL